MAILCCGFAMFFPYILMNWCISIISKSKKYYFLRLFSLTCKLFLWQTWFYSFKRLYWLTSVLNTFQNQNFKRRSFLCVLLYFIRFHRFIQFFELNFYIWKSWILYLKKMYFSTHNNVMIVKRWDKKYQVILIWIWNWSYLISHISYLISFISYLIWSNVIQCNVVSWRSCSCSWSAESNIPNPIVNWFLYDYNVQS